ncbi:MAG TPA: penicillin-binding protein activator [Burkholderiaceae bacterium]|nr:penicillin-binding protein activator [Burkholderiaceae bacterium]
MIVPIAALRSINLRLALLASVACSVGANAFAQMPATEGAQPAAPAIALVLPNQQGIFATAAEAVRAGFFAAHKASGSTATIQVIEIGDEVEQIGTALAAARDRGVRVAVGPLRRDQVNAVVEGGRAVLPLVALNFPDRDAGAPPTMIALGLSAESEAERVVQVALAGFVSLRQGVSTGARIMVLAGAGALERRIAQAYNNALRAAGELPVTVETTPAALARLGRQFESGNYDAVFLALGAREASLVRPRIPRGVAVFGTSLLNVGDPTGSPTASALAFDLEGVRFVDMPWLLQPDHPAVMVYPPPGRPMSLETARLYALGIDAFRIAQVWMKGELRFEVDGVTGRLRVDRAQSMRVERLPVSAIYRNGTIEREEMAR